MTLRRWMFGCAVLPLALFACTVQRDAAATSHDPLGADSPPVAATAADSGTSGTSQAAGSIDAFVATEMATHHREGVQVALVKNGATVFSRAYGKADVAHDVPVTNATIFPVSSMSKALMVVAVLQVLESVAVTRATTLGALLDADVDTLVRTGDSDPLHVRHPSFPDVPITMRMLLTHTSSIQNRYDLIAHDFPVTAPLYDSSAVPDLRTVHERYLLPGGAYFHADNFLADKPGTKYEYSSVASSIAALVVRAQMNVSFEDWTRTHIFAPLGMNDTVWRLAEMPGLRDGSRVLALPYEFVNGASSLVDPPIWEHTFYPTASLRAPATDYARFVTALMNDGAYPGGALLSPATMAEMRRVQNAALDSTQGLIVYFKKRDGFWVMGHGGANSGYLSEMSFMVKSEKLPDGAAPTDLFGTVVLTNGDYDANNGDLIADVESEMFRRALAGEPL